MVKRWEVQWEGELPARPQDVWDAITQHADGYLWKIEYEPRVGGAERGLTAGGGTVTAWEPPRHFATRTRPETERDGFNELDYRLEPLGAGDRTCATRTARRSRRTTSTASSPPAASTRLLQRTPSASTRRTSPAASRSTSASTGRAASAEGGFDALRRALGLPGRRRRRRPRAPDARGAGPDRRRRRLRDRPRSSACAAPTRSSASTGATLGAGPQASRTICSPDGVDQAQSERAWSDWVAGVFETEEAGVMAQYAVLIFERVPPEELPPEVMQGHMEPARPDRRAAAAGSSRGWRSSRRRRRPRSAATSSPTGRSSRPRRRSAASTSSRPATSTTRSRSRG